MPEFENTELWLTTLARSASDETDPWATPRERLRSAFLDFRDKASLLAGEIHRDLSDFTVHDISHSDALWDIASRITGGDYALTPCEAFVLGGAFLVHDLGMGLAAYPGGLSSLKDRDEWADAVAYTFKGIYARTPQVEELRDPPEEVERLALAETLRGLHSEQAEQLVAITWEHAGETYHLLENADLRRGLGPIIGRVAHSHWWSVEKLAQEFTGLIGAPYGYPPDWTVDPVKLACLLRVTDASHLDTRRAPRFLRALRHPQGIAEEHWTFQEHLNPPVLRGDRLMFTSAHAFEVEEAAAWWLCFDHLQLIDRELRQVDALLADSNRERLAARSVIGADDAQRLSPLVPTEGWTPVDAKLKVGDVAELVRSLGGEQLYGQDATVPLRELIQNSCDAVRARRKLERRPDDWGSVTVRLFEDSQGHWIEVEDTGVGMSAHVLTDNLLDFGNSFWYSSRMKQELPGLAASGFEPVGRYGIGFFSVFMWGHRVSVTTRRFDQGFDDTLVLEFETGLDSRPILRKAANDEIVRDGGTRVRVQLRVPPYEVPDGLLQQQDLWELGEWGLPQLCSWLCPAVDVNLYAEESNGKELIVAANDWVRMDAAQLLKRVVGAGGNYLALRPQVSIAEAAENVRHLETDGEVVGRASIDGAIANLYTVNGRASGYSPGVVTSGGLRSSSLSGVAGILVGNSVRATRDASIPVVSNEDLREWASEQATLLANSISEPDESAILAKLVRRLGGDTGELPIAQRGTEWLSAKDIRELQELPNEVLLVDGPVEEIIRVRGLRNLSLHTNVFVTSISGVGLLHYGPHSSSSDWPQITPAPEVWYRREMLEGAVLEALAVAWGTTLEEIAQLTDYWGPESRSIGLADGQEVVLPVTVARNPLAVTGSQD